MEKYLTNSILIHFLFTTKLAVKHTGRLMIDDDDDDGKRLP